MVRSPKRDPAASASPAELEAVAELRVALRRFVVATDRATAVQGLTPRQYDLLAVLHSPAGSSLSPGAIATRLSLSKSAATELLTRAVEAGLVSREVDPSDARTKRVTPTPEGTGRFLAAVVHLRGERARLLRLLRRAAGLAAALSTSGQL